MVFAFFFDIKNIISDKNFFKGVFRFYDIYLFCEKMEVFVFGRRILFLDGIKSVLELYVKK